MINLSQTIWTIPEMILWIEKEYQALAQRSILFFCSKCDVNTFPKTAYCNFQTTKNLEISVSIFY